MFQLLLQKKQIKIDVPVSLTKDSCFLAYTKEAVILLRNLQDRGSGHRAADFTQGWRFLATLRALHFCTKTAGKNPMSGTQATFTMRIDPGNPSNRTCDFSTWYQEPKGSCNTTIHDSTIIQESNLRFLKKTRTWMPIEEDVELKEKSDHHRHLSRRRKPPDETKKIRTPQGEELTESPHK
ncbi:hypothetical protein Tco_0156815 [Tanacetum coccineum]